MLSATQRRLNELEWALARLWRAPRQATRSKRSFGIRFSSDGGHTFVDAVPVDISIDGVALIATEKLPSKEFLVTLALDNKRIQASARCVSMQKGWLRGNVVWRIGARFLQIARADRALIDRFVRRLPLSPQAPQLRQHAILSDSVVRAILQELVRHGRLAPLQREKQPLVKMTYMGVMERHKHLLHSVKIESRRVHEGVTTIYAAQAYINERNTRIEVIPLDNGHREVIELTKNRIAK